MTLPALLLASLTLSHADTTVLSTPKAFLWSRRPEVLLVQEGSNAHLVVTARDPQFFRRGVATLYPSPDTAGKSIAMLMGDSSSVDARSSTNRHTLRFPVTSEQLRAWGAGTAPVIEVGGLFVKLPGPGRKELQRVARGPGGIAPR
jgi:hypothetical protein